MFSINIIKRIICAIIFIFCWEQGFSGEIHFNFKNASGMEFCDETGKIRCISKSTPLKTEYGALRCYTGSDIRLSNVKDFLSNNNELTVCAWIIAGRGDEQTILFKGNRGDNPEKVGFCFAIKRNYPEFKFKDAAGNWKGVMIYGAERPGNYNVNVKIPAIKKKKWNHLSVTFKNGVIKFYVDGKLEAESNCFCKSMSPNEYPVMIGSGQSSRSNKPEYNLNGLINDLRIYDRALDDNQIGEIYRSEKNNYSEKEIAVTEILTDGYDPGFKMKLALTDEYEKNIPPSGIENETEAQISKIDGANALFINGKFVFPMQMMPCPYAKRAEVFNSCRDFAAAGINLYSDIIFTLESSTQAEYRNWWKDEGKYDFSEVDAKIRAIVQANPNALIMIRIKLDPPQWWIRKYPDDVAAFYKDGKVESTEKYASLASETWEKTYEKMLRDFIRHVKSSDYASNIYGYHPAGGYAGEWMWYGQHSGFIDYSKAAQNRFKKYIREKYKDDVAALRAAWNNDNLDFEKVEIPSPEFRRETENYVFRDPVITRSITDFRHFLNNMISGNIIRSCRICKEETDGKKLTCTFGGYSMANGSGDSAANNGMHSLMQILESPYVDMIAAPASYSSRRGGDEGNPQSAYNGSYRLHGKLFWDEADIRTHFYGIGQDGRTANMIESISVLQRAFGYALTKGTGLWWFLIAGNALFHNNDIMNAVHQMKQIGDKTLGYDKSPTSEVALIADEESIYFIRFGGSLCLRDFGWETYCDAARMGAPFDVYLFDDVLKDNFPKYKVYVFMNCFYNGNDRIKKAAAKLAKDNAVLVWCYAPGYVNDKGFSLETMKEITGINLRQEIIKKPVTCNVSGDSPITTQMKNVSVAPVDINPFFYVDDPEATPLIVSDTGTLMGLKKFKEYSSVYTMVPLTKELLLGLCDYAGVHVYSRSFDVLSANKSFIMLHNSTNGKKMISLPGKYDVTELLSGREVGKGITEFTEDFPEQTTRIYKLAK